MCKSNKLFEVDEYLIEGEAIFVSISKNDKSSIEQIPRAHFEKWLTESGRLDWCEDSANCFGEHVQETGTMSIEEYWREYDTTKFPDLYDWLVIHKLGENVFDIQKPLSKILNGYSLTNKSLSHANISI
jgi:hypothetical protein